MGAFAGICLCAVKEKCKKDVAERLWRSIIELYRKEENPGLAGGFLSAGSKKEACHR